MVVNEIVVETVVDRSDGGKCGGQENRDITKGVKLRKYTLQEKKEMVEMMNSDEKEKSERGSPYLPSGYGCDGYICLSVASRRSRLQVHHHHKPYLPYTS